MTEGQQPKPDANRAPAPERAPGTPRWVKIAGLIVAILVLVLIVAVLAGGDHGPGRHQMGAPVDAATQPVVEGEDTRQLELPTW